MNMGWDLFNHNQRDIFHSIFLMSLVNGLLPTIYCK